MSNNPDSTYVKITLEDIEHKVKIDRIGLQIRKDSASFSDNATGSIPQIDAIIGGHTHNLLEKGLFVDSVLISQAGGNPHKVSKEHPVYLGIMIFTLKNGEIAEKESKVIKIGD